MSGTVLDTAKTQEKESCLVPSQGAYLIRERDLNTPTMAAYNEMLSCVIEAVSTKELGRIHVDWK